jgi:hypothetical protein
MRAPPETNPEGPAVTPGAPWASEDPGSGGTIAPKLEDEASVSIMFEGVEMFMVSIAGDIPEPACPARRGVRLSGVLGNEGSKAAQRAIKPELGQHP